MHDFLAESAFFEKYHILTAVNQIDVRPWGYKGYLANQTGDCLSVYYLQLYLQTVLSNPFNLWGTPRELEPQLFLFSLTR